MPENRDCVCRQLQKRQARGAKRRSLCNSFPLKIAEMHFRFVSWVCDQEQGSAPAPQPLSQVAQFSGVALKVARFGRVTRHDSLSRTILQSHLGGGRRRGRQRKCWMDNIQEWTTLPLSELLTRPFCRKDWKRISAELSLMSPQRPNRSRD